MLLATNVTLLIIIYIYVYIHLFGKIFSIMYSPLTLFTILLVILPMALYALGAATPKASTIDCGKQKCNSNTQFCDPKHLVCTEKRSVSSACESHLQCSSGKCYDGKCRQACKTNTDCVLSKERCIKHKYCAPPKH